MTKILITEPALAGMVRPLQERLPGVEIAIVTGFDDDELATLGADADVLVNARRRIDTRTLGLAPRVRFVQLIGVGTDSVDRPAMAAAGVLVAHNPGVNRTGVAELAIMLMLALTKRLPSSERSTHAGRFVAGEVIATGIGDLAGATIGLIGLGDIGATVAQRLVAFGPRIVYHTRHPVADAETRFGATWLPLRELLATSDIVSLHCPMTPATYHLIGATELATMRTGAYLVNTARGGLIDEDALRMAIETGRLAGAALDVLEHETEGHNPFSDLPDVIVTPHVGGGSRNSLDGMVVRIAANIEHYMAGEPLADPVPLTPAPA
jgi:glyoxylate reductase